jgi:YidC/Oxa1 family membrane protein insertase
MESGRFLLAVVLMIAVVVITNILLPPPRPQTEAAPASPAPAAPAAPERTEIPAAAPGLPAPVVPGDSLKADTVWATSPRWRHGISTLGGAIVFSELLAYESFAERTEGNPVQLAVPGTELVHHSLRVGQRDVDLSTLRFVPETEELTLSEASATRALTLRYADPASGTGIDIDYTFRSDDYVLDVRARLVGADAASTQLLIHMGPRLALNEAKADEDERALAVVTQSPETGVISTALSQIRDERVVNGPLTWFALKNKYFLAAALQADTSAMPFGGVIATPGAGRTEADLVATLLPDRNGEFRYRLYLGPQQADRLAALGLQDVSVFGWRFLQPVLRPLGHAITWLLLQMHQALGLGYGWVLILFGFLVRFVLWPLNASAMRSQMRNMEMQPRMKELQTRYKNEPEKLQKEMLRLYKEEGFNPMGGCLPMFLPFPVLITLFFVFQGTIEFRGVSFLWLPDLSRADPFYILPVLLGLSMFVTQWLNMRSMKDQPPQMKYMTYFMPIFLTILFLTFASGLNLYYAAMNVASIPQQVQIIKERQRVLAAKGQKA